MALWSSPVEAKKSDNFPPFHPNFYVPLVQTDSAFVGVIPSLCAASAEMAD